MGDVVNLRQARKEKRRGAKEKAAEQNRHLFGLSKADRQRREADQAQADRLLDGHRRDERDVK